LDWGGVGAAAPFLLFPRQFAHLALGAVLLATSAMLRWRLTRELHPRTPVDRQIVMFVACAGLSIVPSVRADYSLPKLAGVVFGVGAFYAAAGLCHTRALRLAPLALVSAGGALALIGIAAMDVPQEKIADRQLYTLVHHLVPHVRVVVESPTSVVQGLHPNEVAGSLALFVPLAATLAASRGRLRLMAAASLIISGAALFLTQSRIALVGVAVALVVGRSFRSGRGPWLASSALLMLGIVGWAGLRGMQIEQLRERDVTGRLDLWQQAAVMVLDMPATGIGLNTFPLMLRDFYPTVVHAEVPSVPHAHNLLLQTAVDFGLPGLAAFVWMVSVVIGSSLWAVRRGAFGANGPFAFGLILGLLAHALFSLFDAVTLGAKPGVILWVFLGLLAGMSQQVRDASVGPRNHVRSVREGEMLGLQERSRAWIPAIVIATCSVPLLMALVAPLSLNAALVVLHRPDQRATDLAGLELTVGAAERFAWGPYASRALVARALLERYRGNAIAELSALSAAAAAAPWNRSLALVLGDRRYALGDRLGAVETWRAADLGGVLLGRGEQGTGEEALRWFELTQDVDRTNWLAFAGSARIKVGLQRYEEAGSEIAEALRLRAPSPPAAAIAGRLGDSRAPLPTSGGAAEPAEAELLDNAGRVLERRGDLVGALGAALLSVAADPSSQSAWLHVIDYATRLGDENVALEAERRVRKLQNP
jgi:putative inorganic carbon (HCO3(-)) transporter